MSCCSEALRLSGDSGQLQKLWRIRNPWVPPTMFLLLLMFISLEALFQ